MGAPAAVKRQLTPEAMEDQREHARRYRQLAMAHAQAGRDRIKYLNAARNHQPGSLGLESP